VTGASRVISVFVAREIGSRRAIHFNATEHPRAEWTLQQLREALPGDQEDKFLLHDRHKTFSAGLDKEVERWGITVLESPAHAPTANTFCARLIGSIRRAGLDYLIPLNEISFEADASRMGAPLQATVRTFFGPSDTPSRPSTSAVAIPPAAAQPPMERYPCSFFGFIIDFQFAGFGLSDVNESDCSRTSPLLYAIRICGPVYVPIRPVIRI
jgi:hypothetical protein